MSRTSCRVWLFSNLAMACIVNDLHERHIGRNSVPSTSPWSAASCAWWMRLGHSMGWSGQSATSEIASARHLFGWEKVIQQSCLVDLAVSASAPHHRFAAQNEKTGRIAGCEHFPIFPDKTPFKVKHFTNSWAAQKLQHPRHQRPAACWSVLQGQAS